MKSLLIIAFEKTSLAAFATLVSAAVLGPEASAQTSYRAVPNASNVRIRGTSTYHDWEMKSSSIGGILRLDAGVKIDPAQAAIEGIRDGKISMSVHALIPVRQIKSEAEHLPEVMERLTQQHLKADQFNFIDYQLSELKPAGQHTPGKPLECDSTGQLMVAGVTNKVSFPVTIDVPEPGKLKISATVPLKMTDFHVEPPAPNVLGLGLMKCGDEVKVLIDWVVQKR